MLTLVYFLLLIVLSYAADRFNAYNQDENKTVEELDEVERKQEIASLKTQLRSYKTQYQVETIIAVAQGYKGDKIKELKKVDQIQRDEITDLYCKILCVKNLEGITVETLMDALNNFSVLERIAYKKANQFGKNKEFVKLKGTKVMIEMDTFAGKEIHRNGRLSFSCLHYSVTESSGVIEIIIQKHVDEDINFGVRTVQGSAIPKEDYVAIDEVMTMKRNEK